MSGVFVGLEYLNDVERRHPEGDIVLVLSGPAYLRWQVGAARRRDWRLLSRAVAERCIFELVLSLAISQARA